MWNPATYLNFGDQRGRAFHDLIARMNVSEPRRVVDLGCGPGNLTVLLAKLWPNAKIEALDSSPEMVEAARALGVAAQLANVAEWRPAPDTDVVIANAVLQWIPDHADLLTRWVAELPDKAWLAVQVPGNFTSASHRTINDLVYERQWRHRLSGADLRDEHAVLGVEDYANLLADSGCPVDAWSTTYLHRLTGPDPVLEWVEGTALRPIKAQLDDESWLEFRRDLATRLRQAYRPRPDGTTWFPFRRIFLVAQINR